MSGVRSYALGICGTAIICSITMSFAAKGKMQPLLKLICALVLTFAAMRPVLAFSHGDFRQLGIDYGQKAGEAADAGKQMGEDALRDIIIRETSTYILDKAGRMGLSLEVEVMLSRDGPPYPVGVTLRGKASPYERQQLSWYIRDTLGIEEENQTWIF